jgi:defect-in-organelle-trafficking protein DotB
MDSADMANILMRIYGPEALAKLASGVDLDLSYEVRPERLTRYRFRTNITAILSRGRDSVQITLRSLPGLPPSMVDLGIEEPIMRNWSPRQGLILVTGPTGSGKTTLLASGCRMLIEREQGSGKLLTYEAPIEYVYDSITGPRSLVAQSEVPRHIPTFAAGVRNALRRKPNIILVGEARDRETMSAAIEAGQTGHLVFSTVHTVGVAATVRRIISVFEPAERSERAFALMETLRMVVTQALVPKVGGGRIGLREYLVFDDNIREQLLDMSIDKWTLETQRFLVRYGQTMQQAANRAFKQGLIDRRTYLVLTKGYTIDEKDYDPSFADPTETEPHQDIEALLDDDTTMI